MPDWLPYVAVIVPVTALGGLARGVVGFGGPFVMLPIFNLFFAPATSIVMVLFINLLANIKLLPEAWRDKTNHASIPLAVGTVPFLPLGSLILFSIEPDTARAAINGVILACALLLLSGWRYRRPIGWFGYGVVGAVSGVVLGATSIAVHTALFLQSGRDTAVQGRANFIVWAFYSSIIVISVTAIGAEHYIPEPWWLLLALIPIYFAGLIYGVRLYRRMGDAMLRKVIIGFVLVITSVGLLAELF